MVDGQAGPCMGWCLGGAWRGAWLHGCWWCVVGVRQVQVYNPNPTPPNLAVTVLHDTAALSLNKLYISSILLTLRTNLSPCAHNETG